MIRAATCATCAGLALAIGYLWVAKPVIEALPDRVPDGPDPICLLEEDQLDRAVSRPALVQDAKGIVLLVHGTGMTPQVNWDHTLLQPLIAQGYQPYYVEVPYRLLLDTQITAEYISHAVKSIAKKHSSSSDSESSISVISWSAGALATQWTLTFYPETRRHVRRHIALGASYRGAWSMYPLLWLNMHSPAVVQQVPGSRFLTALRHFDGGRALVPTTNIGASTDQIVQPGFYGEGYADSWRLTGPLARNIDLFRVCASLRWGTTGALWRRLPRFISHEALLWEPASHKIIFDALADEETCLGSAEAVEVADCAGGRAPHLEPGSEAKQAAIMPELFAYAPTRPVDGWPEVPLREYARWDA